MHRLFAGLRPPPEVRAILLTAMGGVPGARWQDDGQLHITLRFIGEINRHQAEDVTAALATVHAPALDLQVSGVGTFDRRGRVDTLWARVAPSDAITRLHQKIDAAVMRTGLEPERRAYLPHITLARANISDAAARPFLSQHAGLSTPPFRLDSFLLFESHLGRERATYEAVARYPLEG